MTRRHSEPARLTRAGSILSTVAEPQYVDLAGAAKLLGLRRDYLYQLRSRYAHGQHKGPAFPEPDIVLAGREGWRPATIRAWDAKRPGQGAGGGRPKRDSTKQG